MESPTAVIVECHDVTRIGLERLLEETRITVLAHAKGEAEAVRKVAEHQPSIVLMEVKLGNDNGINALKEMKRLNKNVRVLMLTSEKNSDCLFEAVTAGAEGYALKENCVQDLKTAVSAVLHDSVWLDPKLAGVMLKEQTTRKTHKTTESKKPNALSTRELEVLQCIVQGLSNQEIATKLCITLDTTKTHVRHILEKLNVSDRTGAAVKAVKEGLVE